MCATRSRQRIAHQITETASPLGATTFGDSFNRAFDNTRDAMGLFTSGETYSRTVYTDPGAPTTRNVIGKVTIGAGSTVAPVDHRALPSVESRLLTNPTSSAGRTRGVSMPAHRAGGPTATPPKGSSAAQVTPGVSSISAPGAVHWLPE